MVKTSRAKKPKKTSIPTKTTSEAITDLETFLNGEHVLVYIQDASIGPWDVVPIFSSLAELGKISKLNLILDSIGGFADDAFKIANILHESCEELTVIIPFKAKSAATVLSLAGEKILMSPLAELGPCDPMIDVDATLVTPTGLPVKPQEEESEGAQKRRKRQINALGLRDFLEMAGILKRDAKGDIQELDCEKLLPFCEKGVLNPWLLGDFERSFKQSRQWVETLLTRYMFKNVPTKLERIPEIAKKLTEGYYYHGYPISRREAQELGLEVYDMPEDLWEHVSQLMAAYDVMKKEQKLYSIIETRLSYHVGRRD